MSIDFATLQGLTIPEGVVTQITDASGNVLWSALEIITGTLILRPSADVSIGHNTQIGDKVYTSGDYETVYVAICEEVSDNNSTNINNAMISGYSSSEFVMSGNLASQIDIVTEVILGVSAESYVKDNNSADGLETPEAALSIVIYVNGVGMEENIPITQNSVNNDYELFEISCPNIVAAINEFIKTSGEGTFPPITAEVKMYSSMPDTKDRSTISVSQLYVAISYEGH